MQLKDYYTILGVPSSASPDEIKKAWRRLAHEYHPDKTGSDPYAAAQFAVIKEAYETLIHPAKKDLYLQQRWYAQSRGQRATQSIITPVTLLKQFLELDQYVHQLDEHRMDKEGLYQHLSGILTDENIQVLNTFKEPAINKQIVLLALRCGHLLPFHFITQLSKRLQQIDTGNESMAGAINKMVRNRQQTDFWEKRRIWIVLVLALLLCLFILFTAKATGI